MRKFVLLGVASGILMALPRPAAAAQDVRAVIDKALKAVGGEEKLSKYHAGQNKNKGRLELFGGLAFTQEVSYQLPDKIKESMHLDANGQKFDIVTVYDGEKGWVSNNGVTQEMDDRMTREVKEGVNLMRITRLIALKDKRYQLSPLDEVKVNDRPAVGVKVSTKDYRDVKLYFDKETGLPVKIERQTVDAMSGREFAEERIITDYQEVEGIRVPKKVVVNRDGKKFVETEVVEAKLLDKLDAGTFAKP
jgi:outer membrane lipoprotein-sorting protein